MKCVTADNAKGILFIDVGKQLPQKDDSIKLALNQFCAATTFEPAAFVQWIFYSI